MEALVGDLNLGVFEQFSDGEIAFEDRDGRVQAGAGFSSMQGSFRVNGGLIALVEGLAGRLPASRVHHETRVVGLNREAGKIAAHTGPGVGGITIHAEHAVIALPPRVAMSTIAFDPVLPESVARSLAEIPTWMAGQAKILAVYDAPHWRRSGLSGDASSQKGPMVEIHDASPDTGGPYALFGFVGFPAEIRRAHQAEIMELAKAQLARLFGPEMINPSELILQDWAWENFTATDADHSADGRHPSYGYPRAAIGLWDHRLLLGSTEVASDFGGYLEGALVAARDAARAIERHAGNGA